jgi:hypothetical protein
MELYNTLGERLNIVARGKQPAGTYTYPIDINQMGLKGGVYFINLTINNTLLTQRIVVIE